MAMYVKEGNTFVAKTIDQLVALGELPQSVLANQLFDNIMVNTDSYKCSHWKQYTPGVQYVYSYIESRGGKWDRHVFFGSQMFIMRYLTKRITMDDVDVADDFWTSHGLPFNREGWEYIVRVHGGKLPVEIRALPEGTVLSNKNVLLTIVNTDPNCYWLTSWLETALLRAIWYPTTVATNSYECKQVIREYLELSSDNVDEVLSFALHDFGARGASSLETAAIGGCAHLVNFMGTDTMAGILQARLYYGEKMAGYSIPASEHSTMTSWGGQEGEAQAARNMIIQFGGEKKILACVSDSFDLWHMIDNVWGEQLKPEILALGEKGGRLVVRPDSGVPHEIVLETIQRLMAKFGYTVNSKGFRVLPKYIRVIQGDGINFDSMRVILQTLVDHEISTENVAFGMGGGLLQQLDRDTLKFAMKCSAICINGVWHDVEKNPITDPGKRSKKGRFAVISEDGYYETVPAEGNAWRDHLHVVYRDGELLRKTTLAEVRARSNQKPLLRKAT